jgi:hypothetical protein
LSPVTKNYRDVIVHAEGIISGLVLQIIVINADGADIDM